MSKDRAGIALVTGVAAFAAGALAGAQDARDERAAHGQQVFAQWCAPCHADGPGMPGTQALQVKYDGALPAVLLERSDLTPALISFYVRNGVSVMPHFRKTEISDDDLAALADYIVEMAAE